MHRLTSQRPRQRKTKTDTLLVRHSSVAERRRESRLSSRLHFTGDDGGGFHVAPGEGRKLEASGFTTMLISGA
jgi:hypothetical protein